MNAAEPWAGEVPNRHDLSGLGVMQARVMSQDWVERPYQDQVRLSGP